MEHLPLREDRMTRTAALIASAAAHAKSVQLISDGECFQNQVRDRIGL
jgi:hypothetical protein